MTVSLSIAGSYSDGSPETEGLMVRAGYAYTVNSNGGVAYDGLDIVDISNPASPVRVGHLATTEAIDLWLDYPYCYISDQTDGLWIVDVTDPAAPVKTTAAAVDPGGTIVTVIGKPGGQYVYLIYYSSGVKVLPVDVTDKTAPVAGTTVKITSMVGTTHSDVCIENDILYVTSHGSATAGYLGMLDISDPAVPVNISTWIPGGYAMLGVLVENGIGYIGCNDALRIVDFSTPSAPVILSTIPTGYSAIKTYKKDNRLATRYDNYTVALIDVNDPSHPKLMATVAGIPDYPFAFWLEDDWMYVTSNGLSCVKITEIASQIGWITRRLNHIADGRKMVSLQSNRIVLAPGSYIFRVTAPGCGCGRHQARLMNVSTGQCVLGTVESVDATSQMQSRSLIIGRIEIRPGNALEVQHTCSSPRQIYGLGRAADMQGDAIYTVAEFWPESVETIAGNADIRPPRGFNSEQTKWMNELRQEVIALSSRKSKGYIRVEDRRSPGVQGGGFSA